MRAAWPVLALALTIVAAAAWPAGAHEIGKTQATATIRDGGYTIDVIVDPDALLAELEVFAGASLSDTRRSDMARPDAARPDTGSLRRVERDRRIVALSPTFLDRVIVRFDGRVDHPHFAYVPASTFADAAQSPSIARLSGRVPPGAIAITFAYGLALGSYALNVRIGDSPVQTVWLAGGETSAPISLTASPRPATTGEVAWQYFGLGYTHILPRGLDHILFVVGIFLLSARWRSILAQVSTFTVAHSITLGLTMYGVVSLPARVVEPMIALSIAYVAIENLVTSELKPWRLALVFSFGLLHGMGFAGVLRDLGLPRSQFLTALLTFNGGVEAGQLTVITLAYFAVAYWRRHALSYRRFIVQPVSLAIALAGVYWTIQRLT